jgi:flagellum-specific peptidoglycan hydrolase FlgJ
MNKRYLLIAVLVVLILILSTTNAGKNLTAMAEDKLKQLYASISFYNTTQQNSTIKAGQALLKAGAPRNILPFMLAQIALETGHYKNVGSADNNLSGIKYVGQKGATPGSPAPKNEGKAAYAKYATYEDWAKDFLRILTRVGKARPLNATTPTEYAHALALNGYYDPKGEANYTRILINLTPKFTPISKIL